MEVFRYDKTNKYNGKFIKFKVINETKLINKIKK